MRHAGGRTGRQPAPGRGGTAGRPGVDARRGHGRPERPAPRRLLRRARPAARGGAPAHGHGGDARTASRPCRCRERSSTPLCIAIPRSSALSPACWRGGWRSSASGCSRPCTSTSSCGCTAGCSSSCRRLRGRWAGAGDGRDPVDARHSRRPCRSDPAHGQPGAAGPRRGRGRRSRPWPDRRAGSGRAAAACPTVMRQRTANGSVSSRSSAGTAPSWVKRLAGGGKDRLCVVSAALGEQPVAEVDLHERAEVRVAELFEGVHRCPQALLDLVVVDPRRRASRARKRPTWACR